MSYRRIVSLILALLMLFHISLSAFGEDTKIQPLNPGFKSIP